jgi:hypothetical protein
VVYRWLPGILMLLADVEPYEALQAAHATRRWPRKATDQHGIVYIAIWARTNAGRPIVVITKPVDGLDSYIVGARPLTPSEIAQFELWEQSHA